MDMRNRETTKDEYLFMINSLCENLQKKENLKNVYEYAQKIFYQENEEICRVNYEDTSEKYCQ